MIYLAPEIKLISKKRVQLLSDWVTPYGTIPAKNPKTGRLTISNGANVPRPFRWFLKPMGILIEASIFHDYYYDYGIKTKSYADRSFYKIARDFGVSKFKAKLAYTAVKLFGKGDY